MSESQQQFSGRAGHEEFVEFVRAPKAAAGEFECVACGARAVVHGALGRCECGADLWERSTWSPFANVLGALSSRLPG